METTTREDLLEALKEFDRLSDPLDLTGGDPLRVALRSGRKLSRIARAAVIPPGPLPEGLPLKVRVTRARFLGRWYANRIGEDFEVFRLEGPADGWDEPVYAIGKPSDDRPHLWIDVADCEPLP